MQTMRNLLRRPEARHAGILFSGSLVAQAVLLATTPVLARLFSPEAFGVFALLLTISTVGGAIGGLCYETAVILPRSKRAATSLYWLAMFLSFVTPCVMVGFVIVLQYFVPDLLGRPLPPDFYYCCFVATIITTQINILGYGHSRIGQYRPIAISKVTQTLCPAVFQIALALLGMPGEGLILGRVLGLCATEVLMWRKLPEGFRLQDWRHCKTPDMIVAGRSYKDFLLQVPRQLLVRGATMLPSALLLGAYGPKVAGLYFMAQRLIERPGALLGDSLTRVPMKQFALRVQDRKRLTKPALLYTAAIAVPVIAGVAILAFIAEPLFRIFFGERWVPAAGYAVAIAFWASVRMISLPMATLTTVLRVQKRSLYVDTIFSARVLIIPALAAYDAQPLTAVSAFCGLSILYHITTVSIGFHAASRYDRSLPGRTGPDHPPVSEMIAAGE